jgi:tetratricopeptide (TPR) repeat protein
MPTVYSHPTHGRTISESYLYGTPHRERSVRRGNRCRADASLPPDGTFTRQISKDDVLKRLEKAREYKKGSQSPPSAEDLPQEDAKVLSALDAYATRQAGMEALALQQAQEALSSSPSGSDGEARKFRKGGGNADQAANWLRVVPSENDTELRNMADLRPEEFTQRKEEIKRQRGAVIERARGKVEGTGRTFSEDEYGLAQQQDEAEASIAAEKSERYAELNKELHKPKVATWGIYPRPANISEAYGGGRNLKPGQALESEEAKREREKRVSSALSNYRKSIGLEIDPEVEREAENLFEAGERDFQAGRISQALSCFHRATELVPLRSKIGGRAALQKAICLDSLGKNSEAYPIYKSLEGHSAPGVAKAAKRMLFGFKAAENLKVDTMRFGSGGARAWQGYFDRINANTWSEYRANEKDSEEDGRMARITMAIAAVVALGPIGLFTAYLIAR